MARDYLNAENAVHTRHLPQYRQRGLGATGNWGGPVVTQDSKHTPGPWATEGLGIVANGGETMTLKSGRTVRRRIACVGKDNGAAPLAELKANARLIASAPTMAAEIERLKAALAWIRDVADSNYDDPKLRSNGARTLARISDRVSAALANTEGE